MPNRLASEASPYLLQHAGNPVDWYPWGKEALERAKQDDKPILLSIGYSACHWCHVMERESFENAETARILNDGFVSIKVDREERPDLDQVYQLVVQLMGRSGGWPLTVFLTPEQKPFFGGTYFPPAERYGMPSFPKVLESVRDAFRTRRPEVDAQSIELTRAIEQATAGEAKAAAELTPALLVRASERLVQRFDETNGGFGQRPKFPSTMSLDVLLRAGDRARVARTLDSMRAGGIFDQLAGGFHRYSTDERWLVPHFEKMLYDNALLLRSYVDGWRALGDARYAETARHIADYAMREMQSPEGGFYATQDADSEGHEGKHFVWTPAQVDEACAGDADAARIAKRVWGITDGGNFEDSGATVLSVVDASRDDAEREQLSRARRSMWQAREKRAKPFRDEKVLASWNGLMIGAMADAGAALADPALVAAAERAMTFVQRMLVVPDGDSPGQSRVLRMAKDLKVQGAGFLDDHAYVADAALDLYEATGSPRWVGLARAIADAILAHFYDEAKATFFFVPDDGEKILVRAQDPHDNAVPSGASVACRVLLRLGTLVDTSYEAPAARVIEKLAIEASHHPFGMGSMVTLADRLIRGTVDVVLVGPRAHAETNALAREVFRAYLPDRTLAWLDPEDPESLGACRLLGEGKSAGVQAVAYVCRGRTCSLPIESAAQLEEELARS